MCRWRFLAGKLPRASCEDAPLAIAWQVMPLLSAGLAGLKQACCLVLAHLETCWPGLCSCISAG
jgi:hypothetical protein